MSSGLLGVGRLVLLFRKPVYTVLTGLACLLDSAAWFRMAESERDRCTQLECSLGIACVLGWNMRAG